MSASAIFRSVAVDTARPFSAADRVAGLTLARQARSLACRPRRAISKASWGELSLIAAIN